MKDNIKNERLELRLSHADKQKLERAANRCGVSVSAYVRGCCMDKAPRAEPPYKFWQLLKQLYGLYDTQPPEKQAQIERLILALQEAVITWPQQAYGTLPDGSAT